MRKNSYILLLFMLVSMLTYGQDKKIKDVPDIQKMSWQQVATKMPEAWYGTDEAKRIADNVLLYQYKIGGWPKNIGFHKPANKEEIEQIRKSEVGATFDNDATTTEMIFLAKVYAQQKDGKYKEAFDKALNYTLEAQYPNGGWPQFYPYRKGQSIGYSSQITYNDNAMVNIMNFLKSVFDGDELFAPMQVSEKIKDDARKAFDKGVECILKTQIVVDEKPTVWCAQHDEKTLAPAKARSYELESFSGAESAYIVLLLMHIDNPTPQVQKAVLGAVNWFENHKIEGIRYEKTRDENGKAIRTAIQDVDAKPIWARFYDLDTEKPFFCDRDGVKKASVSEIGSERRNGYNWYTDDAKKVLEYFPKWTKKWNVDTTQ